MINTCSTCNRLLEEGDKVRFEAGGTYHVLKSAIAYAIDKETLISLSPLSHRDCNDPRLEKDGD